MSFDRQNTYARAWRHKPQLCWISPQTPNPQLLHKSEALRWCAVVESRRVKIFAVLGRVPDAGSVGLWLAGKHQVMAYADEPCIRDARLPK